jgi:hypothetical protein
MLEEEDVFSIMQYIDALKHHIVPHYMCKFYVFI